MKGLVAGGVAALALGLSSGAGGAEAECGHSRECLADVMSTYLQALTKHDPASLPITRNVKYTENGVRLAIGDGLWQTAAAMPTYRLDLIDEEAGQVGLLGRINENGNNNWYARAPEGGARSQGFADRDADQPQHQRARRWSAGRRQRRSAHRAASADGPADSREQALSRAELARIGDTYFTGLDTEESGRNVPFSPECQRRENGTVLANNPDAPKGSMQWLDCKAQFDTGFSVIVTDIRERRFEVVDRTKGLAFGWGYFDHNGTPAKMSRTLDHQLVDVAPTFRQPFSFYIAEVFKVVDGKIRQIEAVLTPVPYQMESGW